LAKAARIFAAFAKRLLSARWRLREAKRPIAETEWEQNQKGACVGAAQKNNNNKNTIT
jgi:hypothetical protein